MVDAVRVAEALERAAVREAEMLKLPVALLLAVLRVALIVQELVGLSLLE